MTKAPAAAAKTPRCKTPPAPTREEYRSWFHHAQREIADLKEELAKARVTIDAMAYSLAYRSRRTPDAGDDIPF